MLLLLAPLTLGETVLQTLYFLQLKPEIITSCCSTLFSSSTDAAAVDIAAPSGMPIKIGFVLTTVLTLSCALQTYRKNKAGWALAFFERDHLYCGP